MTTKNAHSPITKKDTSTKSLDMYKTPEKRSKPSTSSLSSTPFNILNKIENEGQTDSPLLPFTITPSSLKLFDDTNLFGNYLLIYIYIYI